MKKRIDHIWTEMVAYHDPERPNEHKHIIIRLVDHGQLEYLPSTVSTPAESRSARNQRDEQAHRLIEDAKMFADHYNLTPCTNWEDTESFAWASGGCGNLWFVKVGHV